LTLAISGVFLRLYITEKNEKAELEKEFRTFMANSLSKQIDVSKDVIQLVTRNKDEVKDALNTFTTSDVKIEALIAEVKSQLERVESAIIRMNP
jgi:metal-responsive CopG/Arc/MetJ family transcriptional regulator